MSEWRKDPVVDRWVVISTERNKRPHEYKKSADEVKRDDVCPLCEGREKETPPEIFAYREYGSSPDTPGWWVRVVPNKFPAVRVDTNTGLSRRGVYSFMNGLGAHEVIVESTEHVDNIDTQSDRQVEEIIRMWRDRALDLRKDTRLKYIQIFKNYGPTAGASLQHTHSQLIAIPMVPVDVQEEVEGVEKYARESGRCVFCDIIGQEMAERERVIIEGTHFLSLAPFASRFPFEMWIIPKAHQPDFGMIGEEQVGDLARVFRTSLRKLGLAVNNPPYNMVIHTAPVNYGTYEHYHWHIEIMPRLTIMAGFELGTGFYINPTTPEMAAKVLRDTEVIYLRPEQTERLENESRPEMASREVRTYV